MRAALTPEMPHMNVALVLLAMTGAASLMLFQALRKFRRRVVV